ncbi:PAS domain S-box protein [Acetonema longum]|uniref:Diguanylate cyclase with PAS/PAC sensor n=1 Tax=Acetonema longum DSM 6540 TaxID=1009370 RepID=F7NP23_9FIRM|nr:PAS domain S-box protein [Acetonema longum]EGO62146.1 diguanylate cyclase with PAS/PAC sensor [Acetonema longum DSM 6540]
MKPEIANEIDEIIQQINSVLQSKALPAKLAEYSDQYPEMAKLVERLLALREFTFALSEGDLSQTMNLRGYWPGALKALQANLRHLTWQTSMVAAGDYSQRVDFMGDFSHAFNTMTIRLKAATENEQKYIAELERQQAATRESERKYRLIAENTDDVIWLLDHEMVIRYISPSIERLLGFTPGEVEGKPISQTPLPFFQVVFQSSTIELLTAAGTRRPVIVECEQRCKDRKMIWLESTVNAAQNSSGEMIGFTGVTRNITKRKKAESLLYQAYERTKKRDFFNQLAARNDCNDTEVLEWGWRDKIYVPKDFSLFFLSMDTLPGDEDSMYRKQQMMDALVDQLNRKERTNAWETARGVGIITPALADAARKQKELAAAADYMKYISMYLPDTPVYIGTANYSDGWANFANRLKNAATAIRIGRQVWPHQRIYHYEDCGIYQVLAPFAATDEAAAYITQRIGPLMAHPDLLETLEKLLSGLSFKEIGAQMYLHHKTIQLRKQRIEQLLNVSLDSYEVRMALSSALQLMKIVKAN